jgi:mono/diheme cytochrome c family protein
MTEVDEEIAMNHLLVTVLCIAALAVTGALRGTLGGSRALGAAKTDTAPSNAKLLAAEKTAWQAATPVLQKHCASCHTRGGKAKTKKRLDHFDFTSYPVGGHHANKIGVTVRTVLGLENKKATMPSGKPGSVTGDDLAAIKAWTEAWDAADKAGAHTPTADHTH